MAKKIRLKGHETFILREGWLTKGLIAVNDNPKVFSINSGADELGVGTNMAKAIRYWLKESGLIFEKPKTGAELSILGQIIYENDRYFEDDFSLWLVHVNLAMNCDNATSWYLFFNEIESEEFSKDELEKELKKSIMQYADMDSVPERSVSDDCNAIINMYYREKDDNYDPEEKKVSPFAHLGLLKKSINKYKKSQPMLDTLDPMLILYILQKYFIDNNEKSIAMDKLLKGDKLPGKLCNINRVTLNSYLDKLADEGYITVNRTAGLDMVYANEMIEANKVVALYWNNLRTKEKMDS